MFSVIDSISAPLTPKSSPGQICSPFLSMLPTLESTDLLSVTIDVFLPPPEFHRNEITRYIVPCAWLFVTPRKDFEILPYCCVYPRFVPFHCQVAPAGWIDHNLLTHPLGLSPFLSSTNKAAMNILGFCRR